MKLSILPALLLLPLATALGHGLQPIEVPTDIDTTAPIVVPAPRLIFEDRDGDGTMDAYFRLSQSGLVTYVEGSIRPNAEGVEVGRFFRTQPGTDVVVTKLPDGLAVMLISSGPSPTRTYGMFGRNEQGLYLKEYQPAAGTDSEALPQQSDRDVR